MTSTPTPGDPAPFPSPTPSPDRSAEALLPLPLAPEATVPTAFAGSPLILLPTLNEEAGLRATLEELGSVPALGGPHRPAVLVVDGHSTDQTRSVARQFGTRLIVQSGRGKGSAVREGLEWARAHGYDTISVLDADGTYPCDRLPTMIRLLETDADVVAGVRRPTQPSDATARNLVHRVGNGVLNLCAAGFSGGPILDVCSGFWGIRTRAIATLELESTGFEVESELFVKSVRRGLRVVQIPVDYRPRIGEAKLHAARDGARILLSILHHARSAPTPAAGPVPPSRPRRRPASVGDLVAGLPSVLSAFQATAIVVVAPPSRLPEATQVARSVLAERVAVSISPLLTDPEAGPSGRPPEDPGTVGSDRPTIFITLPDPISGLPGPRSAFVQPPSGQRTLLVEPGAPPRHRRLFGLGRATPREPRYARTPGPFAILRATLDASGAAREMALVAANVGDADLRVTETLLPRRRLRAAVRRAGAGAFQSTPVTPRVTGSR